MNDEDEIDILGDFKLDTLLSKGDSNLYDGSSLISQTSDLLNCDYTIHPQWLLDRPSANPENWYPNTSNGLPDKEDEASGHFVSTENSITDESGWTEKEKNLLKRGIEIFGKSYERLAQFIGSKHGSEVKYYLKNFHSDSHNSRISIEVLRDNENSVDGIFDDNQIPTSIEEVIEAVSTAKPTIQTFAKKTQNTASLSRIITGRQFPKSNTPFKMSDKDKLIQRKKNEYANIKGANAKMKNKISIKTGGKNAIKQKMIQVLNEQSNENEIKTVEITTGQGLALPIYEGEEIVKIKRDAEECDTDTEIDVELSDDDVPCSKPKIVKMESGPQEVVFKSFQEPKKTETNANSTKDPSLGLSQLSNTSMSLNEELQKELMSMEEPKSEVLLDIETVTDLEKVIHHDYFEGSITKTPERYLKIRNHIIKGWASQKPNYLFKTISRQGLKNCGDVNSFGRVHSFLEQIGAINFGCSQVIYCRPLIEMIQEQASNKERKKKKFIKPAKDLGARPRHKPKLFNDGEGGYTLSHDEHGHVIKHTVVNQEPAMKNKQYVKKPIIRLIYCRPFTEENQQPFSVTINLSTLLKMDFHSHTSQTEVMGLVAGFWTPQSETLTICHYEPCRNIASSATHCDMCPISQAKAADTVHSMGNDILGWFHSHPTFAPEPSNQDLETQTVLQQWIGRDKPCVGVIMSPFSSNGALIASPVRCMIVGKKQNFEDQFVPYKFEIDIDSNDFVVENCLNDLRTILEFNSECNQERKVDFAEPYFQDGSMSLLDKFITSVRMRTARCALSKATCNILIEGVKQLCLKN
ncbi:deubiquitinase MYSM1 [Leptinotarsa decemlineata]|uniref:deubiquitinase MYSM1 n=1 Tax=Leptinotarsa decemlineata TaxID=7539 RepID=UPI003D3071E8